MGHIWTYREYQTHRDAGAYIRADVEQEAARLEAGLGTIGVDLNRLEVNIRKLEEVQRESAVVGECWTQLNLATGLRACDTDDPPPNVNNQTYTILPEVSTGDAELDRGEVSWSAQQVSLDAGSMVAQPPSSTRGSLTSQQASPGDCSLGG